MKEQKSALVKSVDGGTTHRVGGVGRSPVSSTRPPLRLCLKTPAIKLEAHVPAASRFLIVASSGIVVKYVCFTPSGHRGQ